MIEIEEAKRNVFSAILKRREIAQGYKQAVAEFERRIGEAERKIADSVQALKGKLDQESALALARELYWDWADDVRAGPLCALLDLPSANLVSKTVGPTEVVLQCRECREDFALTVGSRTALKELDSRRQQYLHICDKCNATQGPKKS
jgi:hypothetical protein